MTYIEFGLSFKYPGFTYIITFNPHTYPKRCIVLLSDFTDEEMNSEKFLKIVIGHRAGLKPRTT